MYCSYRGNVRNQISSSCYWWKSKSANYLSWYRGSRNDNRSSTRSTHRFSIWLRNRKYSILGHRFGYCWVSLILILNTWILLGGGFVEILWLWQEPSAEYRARILHRMFKEDPLFGSVDTVALGTITPQQEWLRALTVRELRTRMQGTSVVGVAHIRPDRRCATTRENLCVVALQIDSSHQ